MRIMVSLNLICPVWQAEQVMLTNSPSGETSLAMPTGKPSGLVALTASGIKRYLRIVSSVRKGFGSFEKPGASRASSHA